MADKEVIDVRWLDALREFKRTHKGRNPNTFEAIRLRESLRDN